MSVNSNSLFHLLLQCTQHKNLQVGSCIHARIIKMGTWHDIFLANSVVNMYAKTQNLIQAQSAFDEMYPKDVVSWNSLINAYSQQGSNYSITVLKLFKRMLSENGTDVIPNSFTFAGVLTAVASLGSGGKEAHCVAVKVGDFNDVFLGSSLLNMYCKLGSVQDARKLFDRMIERNNVTWASMISGYASNKCGFEGFKLFKLMLEEGECSINEFVITSVLSALSSLEFVKMGRQVHSLVIKKGLLSFVTVENSLVTLYSKCECLDDAVKIFLSSSGKTTITWSAMVTGYAQNGESMKALKLFSQMHKEGVMPSEFTLVGVLNACSDKMCLLEGKQAHALLVKVGYEYQVYIKSTLVDMYANCSNIEDARKGFDQLDKSSDTDTVLWSTMIGGYGKNGEAEEALAMFIKMLKLGISPNHLTITAVLRACSSLAAVEQGKQVHAVAVKHGLGLGIPLGSALSTMYAKCGSLDDCSLVFRKMLSRDVVAWNSIISAFSQNGQGMVALDLFEQMKLEGIKPDDVTFINILFTCSHMGLVERGWSYFKSMYKNYDLSPKLEHYACMVDVLSRAGLLEEAKSFIETVPIDHGLCLWRIVLGACREYKNFEVGAYAGERLIELGTEESSAYILLSNIYAAWRRWDDVKRVRGIMKMRGVSKDPGCSWIEIQKRVHVFVAGEDLHPDIRKVYVVVKFLKEHMKDEGYIPVFGVQSPGNLELEEESCGEEEMLSMNLLDFN